MFGTLRVPDVTCVKGTATSQANDEDNPVSSKSKQDDDAARAIRFMAIKAGVFIGIPLLAAIVAVVVMLG